MAEDELLENDEACQGDQEAGADHADEQTSAYSGEEEPEESPEEEPESDEAADDGFEEVEIEFSEDDIEAYIVDEDDNEIGFIMLDEDGNEVEYYYTDDDAEAGKGSEEEDNPYDLGITREGVAEATSDMNDIYHDGIAIASELKEALTDIHDALDFSDILPGKKRK